MTCHHARCVIDVWSVGYRLICQDCEAIITDPPTAAATRPCGCDFDPVVFGHYHQEGS